MVSPERLDALQGQWVRLLAGYGVGPAAAYPVFDRLVMAYTAPDRHYHNLEHVAEMLKVTGRLAKFADDPAAVQLAVWFHDAVYDPSAADNELQSASLAGQSLIRLDVPNSVTVAVIEMILDTKHTASGTPDQNTAVLLDADLAILAAAEPRYARYAADVRKEYAHVPDAAYRAGRAAVLESFLARPRIYHTEAMFQEGETSARRNLAAEIARLSGGSATGTLVAPSKEP